MHYHSEQFRRSRFGYALLQSNLRVLEAELQFALLPDQEISGLALDVQGEMRRGVPVAKERGQEVFEDIVRKNVDPALLEATQGNNYRLRLYPVPADGTRRVAVRFLQRLTELNGAYALRVPLAFAKHLDNFRVEVLAASDDAPQIDAPTLGLIFKQNGRFYRGVVEKRDFSPEGWVTITLPAPATKSRVDAVQWQDRYFFAANAAVPIRREKRALPNLVTIVWDASGSGENHDHAREYELLDAYFFRHG